MSPLILKKKRKESSKCLKMTRYELDRAILLVRCSFEGKKTRLFKRIETYLPPTCNTSR